ncbi:MAG: ATP-binding cassette domain-containing protein [Pseudomonadota bacterium]
MIEIKNLDFSYRALPPVFEGFHLKVRRGEAWTVIGPSGCGKTTFLYLVAGLLRSRAGEVRIDGAPILRPRPETGLVLQDHGLLPWATVKENAGLGLRIRKFYGPDGRHAPTRVPLNREEMGRRVHVWLKRLGIEALQGKYPSQLSRGERQRTAIARTMALGPDLLLMDEPFSALDATIREDLQRLIMTLRKESGLTLVLVTHDIEEALFLGEKVLVLKASANREPHIIENDLAGLEDYRSRPEFKGRTETLRIALGELK